MSAVISQDAVSPEAIANIVAYVKANITDVKFVSFPNFGKMKSMQTTLSQIIQNSGGFSGAAAVIFGDEKNQYTLAHYSKKTAEGVFVQTDGFIIKKNVGRKDAPVSRFGTSPVARFGSAPRDVSADIGEEVLPCPAPITRTVGKTAEQTIAELRDELAKANATIAKLNAALNATIGLA